MFNQIHYQVSVASYMIAISKNKSLGWVSRLIFQRALNIKVIKCLALHSEQSSPGTYTPARGSGACP